MMTMGEGSTSMMTDDDSWEWRIRVIENREIRIRVTVNKEMENGQIRVTTTGNGESE